MLEGRPTDLIQSVSRAFRIIDALGSQPGGMNAKQVARSCDLALPTAYHLLRTLCYEGYVTRRRGGTYVLGLKIADRFHDLIASIGRPPGIHDVLRQVATMTGHTTFFAQIVEGRVVVVDLVEGPRSPHVEDLVVGFDDGAHATALGKALLSTLPPPARHEFLTEQGLRPFTSNTIVDVEQLDHELDESARRRTFTEEEQFHAEVCCAAVLITGEYQGTIGMSVNAEEWIELRPRLIRQLRLGAGDLSVA